MNSKILLITQALILTSLNYSIAFLLSSREIFWDYKNFLLILFFSVIWMYLEKQFKSKVSFSLIYIFSCILGFIIPVFSYFSEPLFLQRLMKDFLFWYTIPLIPMLSKKWVHTQNFSSSQLPYFTTLLYVIALIPLSTAVLYYATFNTQISIDSIVAILQTNKQEAMEFLMTYTSVLKVLVSLFLAIFVIISIFKLYYKLFVNSTCTPPLHNRYFFIFLNVIIAISCFTFAQKSYLSRSVNEAIKQNNMIQTFSLHSKERMKILEEDTSLRANSETGNFAIIIGETHTRSHMSAYGYQRNTTPWLNQEAGNKNIILLKNGFSNSAATTPSLQYALTATNQYNMINFNKAITITEIAKANGFNVIWISNQIDDNIAGLIGHEADQQYWLNQHHTDTWMRQKNNSFDDKIISCLENLDKPKAKTLFIINLLGSHASYDCRYPDSFNKWDDRDSLLNAYDNSILYNDYVMSKIYNLLFDKFNIDGMMYFADHGEELKYKFCHGVEYFNNTYQHQQSSRDIVKIPIYFSFSTKYKQTNPELISNLILNKDKYFTNDMSYDTMLGIMHITPPYYSSKYDITSKDYSMSLNELRTIHGKVKLENCL